MKLGSLFDGIGTFPLSGLQFGFAPIWASEIEAFPIAVTKHHFPDMKHLGDITKINGAEIEPVDVICGGFPCQDVSVAGLRAGLDGRRSGLFFEAARVIEEMLIATNREYPKFVVIENVPGLLSSNDGKDMETVLDTMQELGFVIDVNILDAQYMGVPQRRRRVFIVCQSVETILQQRTIFSAQIIIQLLTECLLIRWTELSKALGREPENLDCRTKNLSVGGLQKRMQLFSLGKDEHLNLLLANLRETLAMYLKEQERLALNHGVSSVTKENIEATRLLTTPEEAGTILASDLFIPSSWRNILGESSPQTNESTTSMETSETIELKIYGCAEMLLNIAKYTILLNPSCQDLLNEESLILTGLKECTSYARQSSNDLFTDMEWILRWNDYLQRVSDYREQIERCAGTASTTEVFSKREGLPWNSKTSGKEGQEVTGNVGDSVEKSIGVDLYNWSESGDLAVSLNANSGCSASHAGPSVMVSRINCTPEGITGAVSSKRAKGTGAPAGDECYNLVIEPQLYDMTHADEVMRPVQEGLSPTLNSRMGTGGNQVPVMLAFGPGGQHEVSHAIRSQPSKADKPDSTTYVIQNATRGKSQNGLGISQNDVSYTLDSLGNHAVCIQGSMIGRADKNGPQGDGVNEEVSFTLNTIDRHAVATRYAVRRLTPLECERLQGLPTVMEVNIGDMTIDEHIAFNLAAGNITVNFNSGAVFAHRGPGGGCLMPQLN